MVSSMVTMLSSIAKEWRRRSPGSPRHAEFSAPATEVWVPSGQTFFRGPNPHAGYDGWSPRQLHGRQQKTSRSGGVPVQRRRRRKRLKLRSGLLPVQVALIGGVFAGLHLLDYSVNHHFLKGLIPKGSVHVFFITL
jgi:hypothetical protein